MDAVVERLARLMEGFLKPLVERLGFSIESVEDVRVDPEGPRITVRCGRDTTPYRVQRVTLC